MTKREQTAIYLEGETEKQSGGERVEREREKERERERERERDRQTDRDRNM